MTAFERSGSCHSSYQFLLLPRLFVLLVAVDHRCHYALYFMCTKYSSNVERDEAEDNTVCNKYPRSVRTVLVLLTGQLLPGTTSTVELRLCVSQDKKKGYKAFNMNYVVIPLQSAAR
jgi:hypothetical protein